MAKFQVAGLFREISSAWLGVLRIGFGGVMLYEALWLLGWTPNSPFAFGQSPYAADAFSWTFRYPGFDWAVPLSQPMTSALLMTLALASVLVVCGLFYRAAMATIFVTFSYINLVDTTHYLNHFYLASVIAFLMIWLPADRGYTIRLRRSPRELRGVPRWTLLLMRSQVFLVYFFAGLAKINADWLAGEPLRRWLPHPSTASGLEPMLGAQTVQSLRAVIASESGVMFFSYAGLVFDLMIGFLLCWRRTRLIAFGLVLCFHGSNFFLFDIGAFPVFAVILTTVFFDPDWPRRLAGWFTARHAPPAVERQVSSNDPISFSQKWIVVALVGWLSLQLWLPLRHYCIPGNVSWTEEGHRFSWRMKLRDKEAGRMLIELKAEQRQPVDWRYHHVDARSVDWSQLPALVVIHEPLLGERVFFNPLAARSWGEAAVAARTQWRSTNESQLELQKTLPLDEILRHLRVGLQTAARAGDRTAARSLAGLGRMQDLRRQLSDGRLNDGQRHELESIYLQTVHSLPQRGVWRKKILSALMYSPPFALQGAAEEGVPFMWVRNESMLQQAEHCCVSVDRERWPGAPVIYIDFQQQTASSMRALPQLIDFRDFQQRPTTFWNAACELTDSQYHAVQCSPLLQHRYARHIAAVVQDRWGGSQPGVHVTSYVKLNQHPMQLLVDPDVNLARATRSTWNHNSWILPLVRSVEADGRDNRHVAAR